MAGMDVVRFGMGTSSRRGSGLSPTFCPAQASAGVLQPTAASTLVWWSSQALACSYSRSFTTPSSSSGGPVRHVLRSGGPVVSRGSKREGDCCRVSYYVSFDQRGHGSDERWSDSSLRWRSASLRPLSPTSCLIRNCAPPTRRSSTTFSRSARTQARMSSPLSPWRPTVSCNRHELAILGGWSGDDGSASAVSSLARWVRKPLRASGQIHHSAPAANGALWGLNPSPSRAAHATQSSVIYGVLAVIFASNLLPRHRPKVFAAAVLGPCALPFHGLPRAHWLSDVAAGLAFGTLITAVFARALGR